MITVFAKHTFIKLALCVFTADPTAKATLFFPESGVGLRDVTNKEDKESSDLRTGEAICVPSREIISKWNAFATKRATAAGKVMK